MEQAPTPLTAALACKCPRCGQGDLYKSAFSLSVQDKCPECGLILAENDNGDGPAVFLIFILGFLLVPLALIFEQIFSPPLWVHAVLWTVVALGITLGSLRPLKAFIMALQFKHRPGGPGGKID
jgi:uncharacterized protein (DUF983 family)